jgi:hypothetical protein
VFSLFYFVSEFFFINFSCLFCKDLVKSEDTENWTTPDAEEPSKAEEQLISDDYLQQSVEENKPSLECFSQKQPGTVYSCFGSILPGT